MWKLSWKNLWIRSIKKKGELEENSLEGKGEIMLENEEEYKEFNVDGEEGSADKESTVSSFECLGPSISVQQDVGATSTALAKKFQLDKSRQDNEDRKRKSKAKASSTLNTIYRPVNSDGNNKRQFEPNSEPNSEESSDGPQARSTGKLMTFPKKGIYYHYCHHAEDKAHLCVYILCCACFEVKKRKEEQACENGSTRTSKRDKKAKKNKLAEEWSSESPLEPRKKCNHETSELKG